MTAPFRTTEDYELFLYTIVEQFPSVIRSTLTLVRLGSSLARVSGELFLDGGIRLVVRERLLDMTVHLSLLTGTDTRSGRRTTSCTGMILSLIRTSRSFKAPHPHHKHISSRHQASSYPGPDDELHAP